MQLKLLRKGMFSSVTVRPIISDECMDDVSAVNNACNCMHA
jgi:hypothetical protein